ncbi:MAG: fasciclin domain-containing protein [Eudoraea sp.]|nr:fasciclin domain-containing protein [Eudoraea sp.]
MKKALLILTSLAVLFAVQVSTAQMAKKDIVEIAVSNDNFSTLVTALQAADLVSALQGEGPFTVFAPLNSGFAKIDSNTLNSLLQPENKDQLAAILTYHVVAGKLTATDVVNALNKGNGSVTLTTLGGSKIMAKKKEDGIYLKDQNGNYSKIAQTDVMASNGVIHVIEDVVMPK